MKYNYMILGILVSCVVAGNPPTASTFAILQFKRDLAAEYAKIHRSSQWIAGTAGVSLALYKYTDNKEHGESRLARRLTTAFPLVIAIPAIIMFKRNERMQEALKDHYDYEIKNLQKYK